MRLVARRNTRFTTSHQKGDLDKAIVHLTEAILLRHPFPPRLTVAFALYSLASVLLTRFAWFGQPEDVKSSANYFRFIRTHFRPHNAFDFSDLGNGGLESRLVCALAKNVMLGSGDTMQDMEEIMAVIPDVLKVLRSEVSTPEHSSKASEAIGAFAGAIINTEVFQREDTQQLADQGIQMIREATVLKPDSHDVSYALASCLAARFEMTHVIIDYEEALAIAEKIVATHSPGDSFTRAQIYSIVLIRELLVSRFNSSSKLEYLEDAIHRIRTLLSFPSLPDEVRANLAATLEAYTKRGSSYLGVPQNLGDTPPTPVDGFASGYGPLLNLIPAPSSNWGLDPTKEILKKFSSLQDIHVSIRAGKITDVKVTVELSRQLLPSQQSGHRLSLLPPAVFAQILYDAFLLTETREYLNEAITTYRSLHKASASKGFHFHVGYKLLMSLITRFNQSASPLDLKECMQLYLELASDGSREVFARFKIACGWARAARIITSPIVSTAYETALSLLQQTLVFCPTLQTQHYNLAHLFEPEEASPSSDYASYQIERGQLKQAIETLEYGRALLWSEMRGLRTSADQLRAADPAIADKFADINRRLESVTTSVAQWDSGSEEIGQNGDGISLSGGVDSVGRLVPTQRSLLKERENLVSHIQSLPGLEDFLKPPSFDVLNSAAAYGPVIIINVARPEFPSSIIILLKDSHPSVISAPSDFHDRANRLKSELLRVRKKRPGGPGSKEYDRTLAYVLTELYELVGKPVVEELRRLDIPEKSRVWWCPTGAFCSLPLHAMGPVPSDDGKVLHFLDMYTPSYTPTLSALIESRKRGSLSDASDELKPSILLVAQPDTLPGAPGEIMVVQTTKTSVTTLISAMATPETVIEGLKDHRFAHFVCHGNLKPGKPFDSSLELHGANLTLLAIVQSQLPAAEFAFLAACHTAELTEDSVADEGLHLAAAMQYCGFRSVVGTMWAMADTDGPDLSKHFYKAIFADKADQNGVLYHERSAHALQIAVKKLRKKKGVSLERWVNFVHYGA